MQRRDVLRWLVSAATVSSMPIGLMSGLQQARADSGPALSLRTLNPHQNATVATIAELIIPSTDTPGAKEAKVNEFIDLLLTDWFADADSSLFLQGLGQVDKESQTKFGSDFVKCGGLQQTELLKQFDSAAMDFAQMHSAAERAKMMAAPGGFFYTFKRLTLLGYYTSEIGFKKELHKTIIPPGHAGCAPVAGGSRS